MDIDRSVVILTNFSCPLMNTQFSVKGQSFALPGFDRSMVLVPGSQVKWIVDQPDSVLYAKEMQVVPTDLSLLDPTMARNPIHEGIIKRDLTQNLGSLIPDVFEELQVGFDEYWGTDTEDWKDVGVLSINFLSL
jgi:hypothetical protein